MHYSHSQKAVRAFQKGNWNLCLSEALYAWHKDPKDTRSLEYICYIFLKSNKLQACFSYLKHAPLQNYSFELIKAQAFEKKGDLLTAIELLKPYEKQPYFRYLKTKEEQRKKLKEKPTNEKQSLKLIDCSLQYGLCKEARQWAQQLLNEKKEDPGRLEYAIGVCYYKEKAYSQALKYFESANNKLSDHKALNYYLGVLYYKNSQYDKALLAFEKVKEKAPDFYSLNLNLAQLYFIKGKWEKGWLHYSYKGHSPKEEAFLKYSQLYHFNGKTFSLNNPNPSTAQPLLVMGQEGIGDQLFFMRYAPLLKERGFSLHFILSKPMSSFLKGKLPYSFPDEAFESPSRVVMGDLPLLLKEKAPPNSLKISPCPKALQRAKKALKPLSSKPLLAFCYRSGSLVQNQLGRVAPNKEVNLVALTESLKAFEGNFIILQYAPYPNEIQYLKRCFPNRIIDLSFCHHHLEDLCAVLYLADEYVGTSSSALHIREALSKPSKILVPQPVDWRWKDNEGQPLGFRYAKAYYQHRQEAFNKLASDLK